MDSLDFSKYNEKAYKRLLVKAIKQKPEGLTLSDMVVLSGLPTDWVEFTLRKLLGDFPCRLKTNPKGELVYVFDLERKQSPFAQALLNWAKSSSNSPYLRKSKQVLHQTISYIVGEGKRRKDRLFSEKIILNYLRANQGNIVVAELVQILGCSIYEAETQAARLLSLYQGEVEVTEEGVIIYKFEDLAEETEVQEEISESLKVWERPLPERKMNDNDEQTNKKLEKYNKRNLVSSSVMASLAGGLMISQQFGIWANVLLFASTTAMSFSAAFFLIPAVRQFLVYLENDKIRMKNVETYLLKGIFNRLHSHISPEKDLKKLIQEIRPSKTYEYWWNRYVPPSVFEYSMILTSTYHRELLLEKKALELEAEISVDQNGDRYYDFERLNRELHIIAERRKLLPE